jgi:ABC-type sugar transport system permease subunit
MRGFFILPMMATPVAIALVWTMMFHPQLGILNYLFARLTAAALGISPRDHDSFAGSGRNLAMDAAGDADRARRPCRIPAEP